MTAINRLGFWNRLAVVLGTISILAIPSAMYVNEDIERVEENQQRYDACMGTSRFFEFDEELSSECWERVGPGPTTEELWKSWGYRAVLTAFAVLVLYTLISMAAAVAKWVWRGRDSTSS